jgi:hypothetical protein
MTTLRPRMILTSALVLGIPFCAQADQWDKKTIITVDQPIQVTNTYLEPGTYVFKLLDSSSDRHIVQIYDRDQNHLIDTVMAIPNYRLQVSGRSQFSFWETPPGTAKAVRAWFYPGDNFGQEFRYPTQLRQVALATSTRTTASVAPPVVEEQKEAVVTPAPAPVPPQAVEQEQPQPEPQQIAQNTPTPPAPEPQAQAPAPAPTPAPPSDETPAELPKTASPYPLIGLGGLLAAGLYSLLRLKRWA